MADLDIADRLRTIADRGDEVPPVVVGSGVARPPAGRLHPLFGARLGFPVPTRLGRDFPVAPVHIQGSLGAVEQDSVSREPSRVSVRDPVFVRADERRKLVARHDRVRGLAIVDQRVLASERGDGSRSLLRHRPEHDVEKVDAPVGHHPAGIVPEPPEVGELIGVDAETVLVELPGGRRTEPHVPVEIGWRVGVGRLPDALRIHVGVVPRANEADRPQAPALHDVLGLSEVLAGSLLGADLDHAVVLAGGLDHHLPLVNGHRDRLLHVHVLAGLAGLDGHVGMPVIRSRDQDRVDVFGGDQLAEIRIDLGSGHHGQGEFEIRLVDFAESDDFDVVGQFQDRSQVVPAATAASDHAEADLVLARLASCRRRHRGQRRRGGDKRSTLHENPFRV